MSDSENIASPEVQEQEEEQPAAPESAPQEEVVPQEAEAAPEPAVEQQDPEPEPEPEAEGGAEAEPEADKAEEDVEKPEEDKPEDEKNEEEPAAAEEPEVEEEIEEPIVITPEGNPHWLSTEDVVSKGLPESEVENFKNFYFKHAHSLQAFYETLKDFAVQTEFVTLSKEEIDALTVEGDVSEEQQQVLESLQERINSVIELYEDDGGLVRINGRSAKDSVLDKNEEAFTEKVRDAVINSLEVEKQSICAYSIWKDQEQQPGALKRGMNKLRASFRRSRASSAGGGGRRTKLEEEKKDKEEGEAAKEEEGEAAKEGEEPKPAENGAAEEGGEAAEVTVEVTVEADDEDKPEDKPEAAADQPEESAAEATSEEPKEEAKAEAEEAPKEEAEEAPKEDTPAEEGEGDKKEGEEEAEGDKKEEGEEIQAAAADGEVGDKKEDEPKPKADRKSTHKKKAPEEHQHKAAKAETLDNRVLRAFGRVMGGYYRVQDGKAALDQLRNSVLIRNDLNKLKAFGGVEGVRVSLSVSRWQAQIADSNGMVFRAFVYNNELTALSQYNDTTYFPNVVHYKDSVLSRKVKEFFTDNIKELLKELNNYIIDFFVAPDKVFVLRLNPFYTSVGACLFTWDDRRVLTKGPFEFRIVDTPKVAPGAYSSYQNWWEEMLNSVLTRRKEGDHRPPSKCVIL